MRTKNLLLSLGLCSLLLFGLPGPFALAGSNDAATETSMNLKVSTDYHLNQDGRPTPSWNFLVPLYSDDESVLFFNPRYHKDAELGSITPEEWNLGIGYRRMIFGDRAIVGANVFYDWRRSTTGKEFSQAGAGLELMTKNVTARLNGYLSLSEPKELARYRWRDYHFAEWSLNYDEYERVSWEIPTSGVDGEVGFKVPYLSDYVETWVYGGGYVFEPVASIGDAETIEGVKGRIEVRPTDYLSFNCEVRDDNVRGTAYYGEVAVEVPFSIENLVKGKNPFEGLKEKVAEPEYVALSDRMYDRVERDPDIITSYAVGPPETVVNNGVSMLLYYVDSDATTSTHEGTFSNPFETITDGIDALSGTKTGCNTLFVLASTNQYANDGESLDYGLTVTKPYTTIWGQGYQFQGVAMPYGLTPGNAYDPATWGNFPVVNRGITIAAANVEIYGLYINSLDTDWDNDQGYAVKVTNSTGVKITGNVFDVKSAGYNLRDMAGVYCSMPTGSIGSATGYLRITDNVMSVGNTNDRFYNKTAGVILDARDSVFANISGNCIESYADKQAFGVYLKGNNIGSAAAPTYVWGNPVVNVNVTEDGDFLGYDSTSSTAGGIMLFAKTGLYAAVVANGNNPSSYNPFGEATAPVSMKVEAAGNLDNINPYLRPTIGGVYGIGLFANNGVIGSAAGIGNVSVYANVADVTADLGKAYGIALSANGAINANAYYLTTVPSEAAAFGVTPGYYGGIKQNALWVTTDKVSGEADGISVSSLAGAVSINGIYSGSTWYGGISDNYLSIDGTVDHGSAYGVRGWAKTTFFADIINNVRMDIDADRYAFGVFLASEGNMGSTTNRNVIEGNKWIDIDAVDSSGAAFMVQGNASLYYDITNNGEAAGHGPMTVDGAGDDNFALFLGTGGLADISGMYGIGLWSNKGGIGAAGTGSVLVSGNYADVTSTGGNAYGISLGAYTSIYANRGISNNTLTVDTTASGVDVMGLRLTAATGGIYASRTATGAPPVYTGGIFGNSLVVSDTKNTGDNTFVDAYGIYALSYGAIGVDIYQNPTIDVQTDKTAIGMYFESSTGAMGTATDRIIIDQNGSYTNPGGTPDPNDDVYGFYANSEDGIASNIHMISLGSIYTDITNNNMKATGDGEDGIGIGSDIKPGNRGIGIFAETGSIGAATTGSTLIDNNRIMVRAEHHMAEGMFIASFTGAIYADRGITNNTIYVSVGERENAVGIDLWCGGDIYASHNWTTDTGGISGNTITALSEGGYGSCEGDAFGIKINTKDIYGDLYDNELDIDAYMNATGIFLESAIGDIGTNSNMLSIRENEIDANSTVDYGGYGIGFENRYGGAAGIILAGVKNIAADIKDNDITASGGGNKMRFESDLYQMFDTPVVGNIGIGLLTHGNIGASGYDLLISGNTVDVSTVYNHYQTFNPYAGDAYGIFFASTGDYPGTTYGYVYAGGTAGGIIDNTLTVTSHRNSYGIMSGAYRDLATKITDNTGMSVSTDGSITGGGFDTGDAYAVYLTTNTNEPANGIIKSTTVTDNAGTLSGASLGVYLLYLDSGKPAGANNVNWGGLGSDSLENNFTVGGGSWGGTYVTNNSVQENFTIPPSVLTP